MADEWVSSNALVSRMNLALVLSGNRLYGTHTDWGALLGSSVAADGGSAAATPAEEARLEVLLLGRQAGAKTRAAVLDGANNPAVLNTAEQDFKAQATVGAELDAKDVEAPARLVRARGGDRGEGRPGRALGPESPLDTMAGLLLGSPEFQRR